MKQRYYSNIYWHFTGSPKDVDWGRCRKPKDILLQGKPRPPEEALHTLLTILETKTLLATCTERISEKLSTQRFCCVTDIPLMDLDLHTQYYGEVALGFNCSRIHTQFTPVLYFPSHHFPRKWHNTPGKDLIVDDFDDIDTHAFDVEHLPDGRFRLILKGHQLLLFATEIESNSIDRYFVDHLKITNFSPRIGESFYQEREWRQTRDFVFDGNSVEAVIVPRRLKTRAQEFMLSSKDFVQVSVLTWEFLRQA
jgi:Putative abortive phage resistance protein AbiGi, antitoxin